MKKNVKRISILMGMLSMSFALGQIGVNTENPKALFHIDGASSSQTVNPKTGDITVVQQSDDFVITAAGSAGLGTITPHPSSILEMKSANKGVLVPKVALTSSTDQVTVNTPATSLLVYNTGTASLKFKGFVFWNGTEWRSLNNDIIAEPAITGFKCNEAVLTPAELSAGVPFNGYMYVPYTGGNGARYEQGAPVNSVMNGGLTAVLQPGVLSTGDGTLIYRVTGTPTLDGSLNPAIFPIPFDGKTCIAKVGGGQSTGSGGMAKVIYKAQMADQNKTVNIGKFSFRMRPNGNSGLFPEIALAKSISSTLLITTAINIYRTENPNIYTGENRSYTSSDFMVFKGVTASNSNYINKAGLFIAQISDPADNSFYRVTFHMSAIPNSSEQTFAIVAEQF